MEIPPLSALSPDDDRIGWDTDARGVAVVTINRPDKRNALALSMWRTLHQVFAAASADPAVRSVILTGEGSHFCAGADISEFDTVRSNAEQGLAYDAINDAATIAIRDCAKPTIAAMTGYAVGGGLAIALACDFRVADATVRAGIPAGRLGLVYSTLDCSLLAGRVGATCAKEILFTGRHYGLEDALRLRLVERGAEAGSALATAHGFAEEMLAAAPLSITGNKAIVEAVARGEAQQRADELVRLIARAFDSADYAEGRRAFAERRDPMFRGS